MITAQIWRLLSTRISFLAKTAPHKSPIGNTKQINIFQDLVIRSVLLSLSKQRSIHQIVLWGGLSAKESRKIRSQLSFFLSHCQSALLFLSRRALPCLWFSLWKWPWGKSHLLGNLGPRSCAGYSEKKAARNENGQLKKATYSMICLDSWTPLPVLQSRGFTERAGTVLRSDGPRPSRWKWKLLPALSVLYNLSSCNIYESTEL